MNFDAQKYIADGGWDFTAIEKTVALGVADEDRYRLQDAYGDDAAVAADMLLEYCKAAVAGGEES